MAQRKLCRSLVLLPLLLLGWLLAGCQQANTAPATAVPPTDTLPAIAPGTTAIIDICQQDPSHPDCAGRQTPCPCAANWQTFADPQGRFTFEYPAGWTSMGMTPDPSEGVRVMDAPSLQQATRWVALQVFPNSKHASLRLWVAENGPMWVGDVTGELDDSVNGVPVFRQRLENKDPSAGGPYTYALLWYPRGDWVLAWTAWPGEQIETLSLLEQMVSTLR